ncbi:MAG: hypothetical protein ACPG05_00955, partial [Bdellovibrionales bacterium]
MTSYLVKTRKKNNLTNRNGMTVLSTYNDFKWIYIVVLTVIFSFMGMPAKASDQENLAKNLEKNQIASVRLYDKPGIVKFYEERNFEPVWISRNNLSRDAKQIIELFEESWKHGFNPDNYAVGLLNGDVSAKMSPMDYELLMSAAIVR